MEEGPAHFLLCRGDGWGGGGRVVEELVVQLQVDDVGVHGVAAHLGLGIVVVVVSYSCRGRDEGLLL